MACATVTSFGSAGGAEAAWHWGLPARHTHTHRKQRLWSHYANERFVCTQCSPALCPGVVTVVWVLLNCCGCSVRTAHEMSCKRWSHHWERFQNVWRLRHVFLWESFRLFSKGNITKSNRADVSVPVLGNLKGTLQREICQWCASNFASHFVCCLLVLVLMHTKSVTSVKNGFISLLWRNLNGTFPESGLFLSLTWNV